MKFFFLEFVYCCGYPYRPQAETSPSPPEETRSLSTSWTPVERRYRSRKRGRLASSRSGSAADWRPSLNAISEDNVPVEREPRAAASSSERLIKQKVAPTARDRPRYHHTDDYRSAPFPAIIPAFSPTPFLF
ncbi:hypothetical protein LguiA_035576 [Lonicera macranthoides]